MSRVDRIGIQWDQWAPVRGKIGGISRVGRAETSTRASHPACICSSRRASDIDSRPRRPSRPLDAPTRVCARAAPALFSPALALVRMWTALLDPVIWAPVSTFCFFWLLYDNIKHRFIYYYILLLSWISPLNYHPRSLWNSLYAKSRVVELPWTLFSVYKYI